MVMSLPGGMDDTGPKKPGDPNPFAELLDLVGALVSLYEAKPTLTLAKKIPPEIRSLQTFTRGMANRAATDAVEDLRIRFEAAQREANKKTYPIADKFYSHSGKEDGMDDAAKLGFERGTAAFETYCRTGYETTFDVLVYEDGTVKATHVNGVALVEPVEI